MNKKLQSVKGKTKMKLYKNISNYHDEMNYRRQNGTFQLEEEYFSKNAQGINKNCHEAIVSTKNLQTKPQVKNMNMKYYDLYYTVIKNIDDKEAVNDEYENYEIDYITYEDFIIPNHNISIKPHETILK